MIPIVAAALAACTTSPRAPVAAPPAELVIASEPCPAPASADAFYAAMRERAGAHRHGPGKSVPGPSLEEMFPAAVIDGYRATVAAGRCRRVRYRSGGLAVVGFILEPAVERGARAPAILVARGGNRDFGAIGPAMMLELHRLVEAGFVVVATQYRGADGGEGTDEFGGADLADLENLVPLARSVPTVDERNLFLLGYSRGGMEAAMALRAKLPVRAAALFSGVYDLEADLAARPEMEQNYRELIPGFATDRAREMQRRGAVSWADEIRTPVLLLAGTRDTRVPFEPNSARLAKLLESHHREHRLVTYDDDHMLASHRAETDREIVDWFRGHLAR